MIIYQFPLLWSGHTFGQFVEIRQYMFATVFRRGGCVSTIRAASSAIAHDSYGQPKSVLKYEDFVSVLRL